MWVIVFRDYYYTTYLVSDDKGRIMDYESEEGVLEGAAILDVLMESRKNQKWSSHFSAKYIKVGIKDIRKMVGSGPLKLFHTTSKAVDDYGIGVYGIKLLDAELWKDAKPIRTKVVK